MDATFKILAYFIMSQSGHILDHEESYAVQVLASVIGKDTISGIPRLFLTLNRDERDVLTALLCAAADLGPDHSRLRDVTIENLKKLPAGCSSKLPPELKLVMDEPEKHASSLVFNVAIEVLSKSARPDVERQHDIDAAKRIIEKAWEWTWATNEQDPELVAILSALTPETPLDVMFGVALRCASHIMLSGVNE